MAVRSIITRRFVFPVNRLRTPASRGSQRVSYPPPGVNGREQLTTITNGSNGTNGTNGVKPEKQDVSEWEIIGFPALEKVSVRKKINVPDLAKMAKDKRVITMVSAYDYPAALQLDAAGIDVVLVGDSLGMNALGYGNTQPVTVDDVIHHSKAVVRGCKYPLVIGDMPFGSYEISPEQALASAYRMIKEGGVDCVKMEGGQVRAPAVKKLVEGGVAVMAHIGLNPQHISVVGGFKAQGRTAKKAMAVLDDALALQEAGAFAIFLECVPAEVTKMIAERVKIPTIGIGAGPYTAGQCLIYHDILGLCEHPEITSVTPRFRKKFANAGDFIRAGLVAFKEDVQTKQFPAPEHYPYKISAKQLDLLYQEMEKIDVSRNEKPIFNGNEINGKQKFDGLNRLEASL